MIIKPLALPLELLQIEALNERLPSYHKEKGNVEQQAKNLRAGYNGENALQYNLSFLPYEQYLIFHQLRLHDAQGAFQMDILLVSARFLLIIEVKNIRDHVIFDEMGQAIRKSEEMEQSFGNPVQQIKLQHLRLLRWLKNYNLPAIPIEKAVVYSNSNTILKNLTNQKELPKLVMHKERLLEKIEEIEKRYRATIFHEDHLMELSYALLASHSEKSIDVLAKYSVAYEELMKGVVCSICKWLPMQRTKGKWYCNYCSAHSKTSHRRAFAAYALLVKEYINNREARDFLQIDSRHIVKQLLNKENFERFGDRSGRRYKLDVDKLLLDV